LTLLRKLSENKIFTKNTPNNKTVQATRVFTLLEGFGFARGLLMKMG